MGMLSQMLANLYQPVKQDKPPAPSVKATGNIPKSVPLSKLVQTPVTTGQFLRGEVLDLRTNQILVLLENGATVSARTEGLLNLSIGEHARFFVAQTNEDQILLKLAKEEDSAEDPMVEKALHAAGITRTAKSVSIVTELLSHSQPVSEANIRHYLSLSSKYPELPVRDFILMDLHQIPVTKETVEQFVAYHDGNGKLLLQATNLINELKTQIEQLPENTRQPFLQELETICTGVPKVSPVLQIPEPDTVLPNTAGKVDTPPASAQLSENQPLSPDTDVPVTIPDASALPSADTSFRSGIQPQPDLLSSFLLTPEEIAEPDHVERYYEELLRKTEQLEQFALKLAEHIKDTAVSTPKQMKSNLSFLESVNQVFPFLQLPLKLQSNTAHGELYVYERKKAARQDDTVSALLHLELDALGSMDIFLTLAGHHVTSRFSLTDASSADLLRKELPVLEQTLQTKGYSLTFDVAVTEPAPDDTAPTLLEQFLEEFAPGGLTRYTFDMRA